MSAEIFQNLAHNLVFLRKSRGLTQTQLAQASSIPRTTLSYIESGSSNPSIKLLLTLATILGVTIEELLASPRPSCLLTKKEHLKHQTRSQGNAIKFTLLPDSHSGLQFERLDLKPEGILVGTPHSKGTREYFTCIQGAISIFVDGQEFTLENGDVLAFPGDSKHAYHNRSHHESSGISIVILHPSFQRKND